MNSFTLKIIALISMLFDHIGNAVYQHISWMNYIGRFAFPIFAFQVAIGAKHTKNIVRYVYRLAIFALISQVAFSFYEIYVMHSDGKSLNVMVTLLLGVVTICFYSLHGKNRTEEALMLLLKVVISALVMALAEVLKCDYGAYGVAIVLLTYLLYDKNKVLFAICFTLMTIVKNIASHYLVLKTEVLIPVIIFSILPVFLMLLYNGKKGPGLKYLFYIAYPLQFAIITALFVTLGG